MSRPFLHKPQRTGNEVPEESEPEYPQVEPDEGLVPPLIAEDPEHERVIDPGETPLQVLLNHYQFEEARRP
jgi:hypothetical protein